MVCKKCKLLTFSVILLLTLITIAANASTLSTNNIVKKINKINVENSGVKVYNDGCCEGYNLLSAIEFMGFSNGRFAGSLLIDMNGNLIKKWNNTNPMPAKMLPDGSIISGYGGIVEWDTYNLTQFSWNGTIKWDFSNWRADDKGKPAARHHHDFQREGNPVGYYVPDCDFVENGKTLILAHDTIINHNVSKKTITDDVIYEVNWNGSLTGFEWYASDHIDEMGFNLLQRIGIYINPAGPSKPLGCLDGDWLHTNSISYLGENKWYDQGDKRFHPDNIITCSRNTNIIYIISKETGEIVYRIGPSFSRKTEEGKKLGQIIGPHNAHIIPKSLPGEGNILVFDNGGIAGYGLFGGPSKFRFYSRVIEFDPISLEIKWEYAHKKGFYPLPRTGEFHRFFSPVHSSMQRLPNGNTLITEGFTGRVFEVNKDNEILWEYISESLDIDIYRAYRIPPEWVPENPGNYDVWTYNN